MESRKEQAAELKRCGSHNCAQAVLCTYHDYTGIDEETIKQVGNSFATGMGNMEGTCGALVGAGNVLRECPLCVEDAAEFLEEQLHKEV